MALIPVKRHMIEPVTDLHASVLPEATAVGPSVNVTDATADDGHERFHCRAAGCPPVAVTVSGTMTEPPCKADAEPNAIETL